VVVSGHPAERGAFERLANALDRHDLLSDERFGDVAARRARWQELRAELHEAAGKIADAATFEARCAANRLATGRLRSARQLADSEWAAARGAIIAVSDRAGGVVRVPNPPWHFSAADAGGRGEARFRGEDNRAVLAELLGYDDATIDELEAAGVTSSRLPSSDG
jgi:crotonobetainyl-CoA:carnitine CoA-transferase CaiB-like acyl-CoA transferase